MAGVARSRLLSLIERIGRVAPWWLIDPAERGDISKLPRRGFNGLSRPPGRPVSLLTQLFGASSRERPSDRIARPAVAFPTSSPARIAAKGASILLAEDNDINALLACTVLEKSGARVVRVEERRRGHRRGAATS